MPRPKVISFINYKGGVGKTTSTYHVGCSLAGHHKKRVLMIDIDPQTNLTFLCASVGRWEKFKNSTGTVATLYKRWLQKQPIQAKKYVWKEPVEVLPKTRLTGLDLIPCDIDLIGEDLASSQVGGTFPNVEALRKNSQAFLRDRGFLRAVIDDAGEGYDYVLIDCPPNLYLMTQNALAVSDWYVVTAVPDHLSTIGLSILHDKVKRIGELVAAARAFAGGSDASQAVADLGGIMFVKVRIGGSVTTVTHTSRMTAIRNAFPNRCFNTNTTELIGYSEAAEASVPVWGLRTENALRAANKNEYQNITKEFLTRFT